MRKMSVLKAIGNTPLVEVDGVFAKFEGANPGGSIKDRPALQMIADAEEAGILGEGVVEATSGNTGVGLALVAAAKGLRCVIVLPETVSEGKKRAIKAFGARLVETPGDEGMAGARRVAEEIAKEEGLFYARQFENPSNPKAHHKTAAEALLQLGQAPDVLVLGWGTGGTLVGMSEVLRVANPNLRVVAVQPAEFPHEIEGIYPGFVPKILEGFRVDGRIAVSSKEAAEAAGWLAKKGLLVGPSSGANFLGALRAKERFGGLVLTVFPDRAERYWLN